MGHYQYVLPVVPPSRGARRRGTHAPVSRVSRRSDSRACHVVDARNRRAWAALLRDEWKSRRTTSIRREGRTSGSCSPRTMMATGRGAGERVSLPDDLVLVVRRGHEPGDAGAQHDRLPEVFSTSARRRGWYSGDGVADAREDRTPEKRRRARYLAISAKLTPGRFQGVKYAGLYDGCSARYVAPRRRCGGHRVSVDRARLPRQLLK